MADFGEWGTDDTVYDTRPALPAWLVGDRSRLEDPDA